MENDPYILGSQYYQKKNQGEHFQRMYICYSSAGRSVLEKNCTRGFGSALKTEGMVFPNTDEAKLVCFFPET